MNDNNNALVQEIYKTGVTSDAAANAGRAQARQGDYLSPQQVNESADAYRQRQAEFEAARSNKS
jgi:hypothetical protein